MPNRAHSTRSAIADNHLKGSDHDHHHDAPEDNRDCRQDTSDGDRTDSPQDADQPDTDTPRDGGKGTASRGAERAVGGSASTTEGRIPVSRISEESRAYWRPIVASMEPMSGEDLADVAAVLRRIDARTTGR